MQLFNRGELHSYCTSLHIPKTMKPWVGGQEIDRALVEFKNSIQAS